MANIIQSQWFLTVASTKHWINFNLTAPHQSYKHIPSLILLLYTAFLAPFEFISHFVYCDYEHYNLTSKWGNFEQWQTPAQFSKQYLSSPDWFSGSSHSQKVKEMYFILHAFFFLILKTSSLLNSLSKWMQNHWGKIAQTYDYPSPQVKEEEKYLRENVKYSMHFCVHFIPFQTVWDFFVKIHPEIAGKVSEMKTIGVCYCTWEPDFGHCFAWEWHSGYSIIMSPVKYWISCRSHVFIDSSHVLEFIILPFFH